MDPSEILSSRNLVEIHQREIGQPLLQLAQPHSDEVLPLAGGGVVGILAEIAKSGGESSAPSAVRREVLSPAPGFLLRVSFLGLRSLKSPLWCSFL